MNGGDTGDAEETLSQALDYRRSLRRELFYEEEGSPMFDWSYPDEGAGSNGDNRATDGAAMVRGEGGARGPNAAALRRGAAGRQGRNATGQGRGAAGQMRRAASVPRRSTPGSVGRGTAGNQGHGAVDRLGRGAATMPARGTASIPARGAASDVGLGHGNPDGKHSHLCAMIVYSFSVSQSFPGWDTYQSLCLCCSSIIFTLPAR
jgi:hypothetical protein